MITRLLESVLKKSPKSILLLGPRQVGKSTLIQNLHPDLTINLNDEKTYLDFKSNPAELTEILQKKNYRRVFIDEIQRHPALLNTIQVILDSNRKKGGIKFFMTGSSARKLKRGQANLLPGRIFAYQLGPLSAAELGYELNVEKALKHGCLPEPYLTTDDAVAEKTLITYSGSYLKEEIRAEALTQNLEGFSRFLMVCAASAGQILDFSKLAKQAKVERKACSRFYEILEDTLIAHRLEVFEPTDADIRKRPKFYFFDGGVLNGLLENFTVSDDRKGMLFEHLVVNQILSSAKARDITVKLNYFRTRAGFEVDLILEIQRKIYAVEIKSGVVDAADARRVEQFKDYFPKTDGFFIVGPSPSKRNIGEVQLCSISEFLSQVGL